MSQNVQTFQPQSWTLANQASVDARASFIVKTYTHLFGAIATFVALEAILLQLPVADAMMRMLSTSQYSWLIVLGVFMGVSYLANTWAVSATSLPMQYAGLGLYIVAASIITLPMLYVAVNYGGATVLPTAAVTTLGIFTGLTAIVFFTRKNFSFIGPALGVAGFAALAVIGCSIIFGFNLGVLFTVLMIAFACGHILYDTSRVLHEYHIGQHVAASLALFSSIVLLFWYILRLFMSRD